LIIFEIGELPFADDTRLERLSTGINHDYKHSPCSDFYFGRPDYSSWCFVRVSLLVATSFEGSHRDFLLHRFDREPVGKSVLDQLANGLMGILVSSNSSSLHR